MKKRGGGGRGGTAKITVGYVAMQIMVIKLNNKVIKKGY